MIRNARDDVWGGTWDGTLPWDAESKPWKIGMLLPWATLIYIDLSTYNSLARSNGSQSAKECGPQNSREFWMKEKS